MQEYATAKLAAPALLDDRREQWHHNRDGDPQISTVVRKGKRVVPGGRGHHSSTLRLIGQHQERIPSSALLKAPGSLQILALDQHMAVAWVGKRD
jgi:hypothetical protein